MNLSIMFASEQQTPLLSQLRDIHQPDDISWWPLAPGWWVIIGLIVVALLLTIILIILNKKAYRYARLAQQELKQIEQHTDVRWLAKSNHIMRRAALCYVSEEAITSMNQDDWISFIKTTSSQPMNESTLDALKDLPFKSVKATEDLDKQPIINDIHQWLDSLPKTVKTWKKKAERGNV